jgi:hypothetical protein
MSSGGGPRLGLFCYKKRGLVTAGAATPAAMATEEAAMAASVAAAITTGAYGDFLLNLHRYHFRQRDFFLNRRANSNLASRFVGSFLD